MAKPYVIRRAVDDDLETVMWLLDQRISWLHARGSDQWNTGRSFRNRMVNNIVRGETWLVIDDERGIGTFSISADGDPDFWRPDELAESALYLGKMASDVARSGEGLGRLMVGWTRDWAARSGYALVRWDVWRTNPSLQDYYRSLGARHIRTVDVADRWSGALFEMDAVAQPWLASEAHTR
jgi:GNAT superfamily N-acetyltransferase